MDRVVCWPTTEDRFCTTSKIRQSGLSYNPKKDDFKFELLGEKALWKAF